MSEHTIVFHPLAMLETNQRNSLSLQCSSLCHQRFHFSTLDPPLLYTSSLCLGVANSNNLTTKKMDLLFASHLVIRNTQIQLSATSKSRNVPTSSTKIIAMARSKSASSQRKLPKNLRYPRRPKLPPDPSINLFSEKNTDLNEHDEKPELFLSVDDIDGNVDNDDDTHNGNGDDDGDLEWSTDEIEAISSLFRGRIPQKLGNINRERPLPLPLPHKIRPLGLPTPKKHIRRASPSIPFSRSTVCERVYKNPEFLINLAREINSLPTEKDVSVVLGNWVQFLRKGSLSLTIRELGHMGLPERALQTFCWAQKHPHLFPDDRILASTIEILARNRGLKMQYDLEKFTSSASRSVIEAMARGFIRGGSFNLAWRLINIAKRANRTLDASVHAKLIWELGKNPDKNNLILAVLDEIAEMDELNLNQQDCTAVMKVCIGLGKFGIVETLFNWYKNSGREVTIVMYTTLIHSRYTEKEYRKALALVWEMEALDYLLDLPAYRVVIKLLVTLNDVSRAARYFSRLKEAGFFPTRDIYRDMIKIYVASGRLAKCRELCKEVEMAGFNLDKDIESFLSETEGHAL